MPFIVHIQRSATPRHGAVVDHSALFAGHSFADQSGKGRSLLAIEVRFEPVTDGLVQQNSRPSRPKHNFHVSRRSFARIELQNRLPRGLFRKKFRRLFAKEKIKSHSAASAGTAAPRMVSVLAMQETFMRASGCESSANVPSDPTTKIFRSSSA